MTKRGGFRLRARQASSEQNGQRKHDFVQLRHDGEEKKLLVILQHEKHRRARVGTFPKKTRKVHSFSSSFAARRHCVRIDSWISRREGGGFKARGGAVQRGPEAPRPVIYLCILDRTAHRVRFVS